MHPIPSDLINLGVAYLLALPIGWDRERESHTAGIRTFPIVSVACCGLMIMSSNLPGASGDSFTRVLQGVVTGIGFVGAGAIMRDQGGVHGTATAAAVWAVAIVGSSTGLGNYHVAAALSLVTYLTLRLLKPFKRQPPENK